jgi:hypothetical protein
MALRCKQLNRGEKKTYISGTHDATNLLHRVQIGAETSVHGEDLLVNDGGNGQAVEAVGKCLPKLDVVTPLALIVEAVDAVDGGALVVATQNEEVLRVLDLVGKEQADGLERLLATVDVVAQEKVVGLGGKAAILEQAQEIIVLAVNIAANLYSNCVSNTPLSSSSPEGFSSLLSSPKGDGGVGLP